MAAPTRTTTEARDRPGGGGKRGNLEGGALTDEVMDSSASILGRSRGGAIRGLQQWYSPIEAAELIAAVNGKAMSTLDPTAGDGALLAGVNPEHRFGIEIDADQIAARTYAGIHGDLQRVYPLLRVLGARFPRIAANPPFGLDWRGPSGSAESSTVATWRMCLGLLSDDGCGAFIAGRDRFHREILSRPDAAGVYALVECDDLFDGVALPCVIAFFVHARQRTAEASPLRITAARAQLPGLAGQIIEARRQSCALHPRMGSRSRCRSASHFASVGEEMQRIREAADSARPRHDLSLSGGSVHVRLAPFAKVVLSARRLLRNVERLHRQPLSYFGLNLKEWRQLEALAGRRHPLHRAGARRGGGGGDCRGRARHLPPVRGASAAAPGVPRRSRLHPLPEGRSGARLRGGRALSAAHHERRARAPVREGVDHAVRRRHGAALRGGGQGPRHRHRGAALRRIRG